MIYTDIKVENPNNLSEEIQIVFDKTREYINKESETFKKEVFDKVTDDIEEWMFERYENVQRQYFSDITTVLLGQKYQSVKDKEKIEEWLLGIGYSAQSFRKALYEENKEEILSALVNDSLYERLDNLFKSSYFRYWELSDITKNYPQTAIINHFTNYLLSKKGFADFMNMKLDDCIKSKREELQELERQISKINNELSNDDL
jgi:hypothetical protein